MSDKQQNNILSIVLFLALCGAVGSLFSISFVAGVIGFFIFVMAQESEKAKNG